VALAPQDEAIASAIQRWDELQDEILDTHEEDWD